MIELIGHTPMIRLGAAYLKLEYFNPTGSHKDRTAYYMLKDAMSKGLKKGDTVIEYTSGNTGIAVAWLSKVMGFKSIILVPEGTSAEKIRLIKLYGASIEIVPPDVDGHEYAEKLSEELGGVFLSQTKNMANFRAHYETTGPEIGEQVSPDTFVMGAGTGGTVYGAGKYLKEKFGTKIVLLLPQGSMIQQQLQGTVREDREILEGFTYHSFPELIEKAIAEVVDEIKYVSSEESIKGMKMLWDAGIPGGPTSGANYYYCAKEKGKCVTLVADTILRYPTLMKEIID